MTYEYRTVNGRNYRFTGRRLQKYDATMKKWEDIAVFRSGAMSSFNEAWSAYVTEKHL